MRRAMSLVMMLAVMVMGVGCQSIPEAWVRSADMLINETVGPEYETYVEDDESLDAEAKQVRLDNVAAYRRVVEVAKESPE